MMRLSRAVCVLLTTGVAVMVAVCDAADPTAQPHKCCFDKQFTALLGEAGAVMRQGHYQTLKGNIRLAYDFYRSRQGSINTMLQPDGSYKTTYVLADYASDASYVGQASVGYGSEALEIHSWQFPLPGHPDGTTVTLALTPHCVPFAQAIYGRMGEEDTEITYFFTDYHSGIDDLDALNPPTNCTFSPADVTGNNQVGRRSIGLF